VRQHDVKRVPTERTNVIFMSTMLKVVVIFIMSFIAKLVLMSFTGFENVESFTRHRAPFAVFAEEVGYKKSIRPEIG